MSKMERMDRAQDRRDARQRAEARAVMAPATDADIKQVIRESRAELLRRQRERASVKYREQEGR